MTNPNLEKAKQLAIESKRKKEEEARLREQENKHRNAQLQEMYAEADKVLADFDNVETKLGLLIHKSGSLNSSCHSFLSFSVYWNTQRTGVDDYSWVSALNIGAHFFDHNGHKEFQSFYTVKHFQEFVIQKVSEILCAP